MNDSDMHIEYVRLTDILRWPGNPKGHDIPGIIASIKQFGYVQPLLVDETTGRLVGGHGRVEALEAMRLDGATPPRRIRVLGNGDWAAPLIRGVAFESETEAQAYLLADNRLQELGGWDEKLLSEFLAPLPAELAAAAGFSADEVARLAAQFEADANAEKAAREQVDEARLADFQAKWQVQPGSLWKIGPHYLMCGDALDSQAVANLMMGTRHSLAFLDPPNGMKSGRSRSFARGQAEVGGRNLNEFCLEFMAQTLMHAAEGWSAYICFSDAYREVLKNACRALAIHVCDVPIVWVKNHFSVLGHTVETQLYHSKYESLLWVGPNTKNKKAWHGPKGESNVWEIDRVSGAARTGPAQKPVELPERTIINSSTAGEVVLDLFGGTGTTMVAAHLQRRVCRMMEVEPNLCAATLERMSALVPDIAPVAVEAYPVPERPEVWRTRSFNLSQSQARVVDQAIKLVARTIRGQNADARALEMLAADFLAGHPEAVVEPEVLLEDEEGVRP